MEIWSMIHAERAALAEDLGTLDDAQWATQSLCGKWSVREVVAHLSAAASVGRLRWFQSVLGARFNFDLHNQRRLAEHMGGSNADTLAEFRRIIPSTTALSATLQRAWVKSSSTQPTSAARWASPAPHAPRRLLRWPGSMPAGISPCRARKPWRVSVWNPPTSRSQLATGCWFVARHSP